MTTPTLELLKQLIRCPSVTPNDAGCQTIISERLKKFHFKIEHLPAGDVHNLYARHGTNGPLLIFAGHTDVVPPGPLTAWQSDPFEPTLRDGFLYGRGAADMKSGLAAMIIAAERFIQKNSDYAGSIGFLITSDEEGPTNINGTQHVIAELIKRQEKIDYCIIGEATSEQYLGDQIRIGRRGSLSGKLIIYGQQGHVAFPDRAKNPIHLGFSALQTLTTTQWDQGNEFFPATTFQISNIHGGTGALNVIPGLLEVQFNFRFSTAVTAEELKHRVIEILEKHALSFDCEWALTGQPFLTKKAKLITIVQQSIHEITQCDPILSTGGGTSDGRFIAPLGCEVIELGPHLASIHQVNEHVNVADLEQLTLIYERILEHLFKP